MWQVKFLLNAERKKYELGMSIITRINVHLAVEPLVEKLVEVPMWLTICTTLHALLVPVFIRFDIHI